ncbi:MAG: cobyrinate a,c-diamide synthase [Paracoccaceae bacterium]
MKTPGQNAVLIAAPMSGSGKTCITLGLLRALSRRKSGPHIRAAKSGPDYIDPRFHEAACGAPCLNLDAWAMGRTRLQSLARANAAADDLLIIEGAMGLFDGAPPSGKGACADLARLFQIPVILVVDASHIAQSIAPLIAGFARFDPSLNIAGVILNKVGSPRHETMLRRAIADAKGPPVLGAIPRDPRLNQPSRHLGLVQASERADLDSWLETAADIIEANVDLAALPSAPLAPTQPAQARTPLFPLAQHIAIARDQAFAFSYPHLIQDWRDAGAQISFFSPLNDEAPANEADLIYLPGGYPELHAGQIAAAKTFRQAMQDAALKTPIYGECGGYMVLGQGLIDAGGARHEMLGLLDLETSFERRKLHLGYRDLTPTSDAANPFKAPLKAHEFHYASTIHAQGTPLLEALDAEGNTLAPMGLISGKTCGSFAHIIDCAEPHSNS